MIDHIVGPIMISIVLGVTAFFFLTLATPEIALVPNVPGPRG